MIKLQAEDFDIGAELAALTGGRHDIGGLAVFVGLVRAEAAGTAAAVEAMTLEHYPGMTAKMLAGIERKAQSRWPLSASLILHRYGRLVPGDRIVMAACASSHRHAAFEACQFLMDWLKTEAPFWKLEERQGEARWVEARKSDEAARERWERG
ncbi:MAG: molybdenum cofactor biosynthesis protein MoaE [Rhodospirillales bacterium]|nr:molybdenum cofactor biosynthesis protein MoaE [Rhodospirillales bacterium]